jgi:hypothetical protein
MKNYKTVLIALTLSLNAQADIFGDVPLPHLVAHLA